MSGGVDGEIRDMFIREKEEERKKFLIMSFELNETITMLKIILKVKSNKLFKNH